MTRGKDGVEPMDGQQSPNRDRAGPFEPVGVERVADTVVMQIEDLIVTGALRPGRKLPPERELAETLGVSRPKLREAMHRLEDAGLIEVRRSDGAFVRELSGPVLAPAMVALCARHPEAFRDFLDYRREQEALAARFAAERATPDDMAAISAAMEAMEAEFAHGRPQDAARFDLDFHMAVIEAAHNAMLLHVMRSVHDLMARGVFAKRDRLYRAAETREALLAQHRAIAEAIRAGDPDAAATAAVAHIDHVALAFRSAAAEDARARTARRRRAGAGLPGAHGRSG